MEVDKSRIGVDYSNNLSYFWKLLRARVHYKMQTLETKNYAAGVSSFSNFSSKLRLRQNKMVHVLGDLLINAAHSNLPVRE